MSVIEKSVEIKCILAKVIMELSDCIIRDYHDALPFDFDVYKTDHERVACANYYAGVGERDEAEVRWHVNFLNGMSFSIALQGNGEWLISTPSGDMPFCEDHVYQIISESGALLPNVLVHPIISKWRDNCNTAGVDSRLYRIP